MSSPTRPLAERRGSILFLALLSATPPLSTDMYLVAIPHLAEHWQVPVSTINLSLVLWFAAFSVSLLVYGALSDRIGRRPVLIGGMAAFAGASALCALAQGPISLIVFRVLQGVAAGAPSSMALAYCRDRFQGSKRQRILAWIGIIMSVAPMVAPSIGALVMRFAPWQTIFWFLAAAGVGLCLLAWLLFDESAGKLEQGGLQAALQRYQRLARNRNFVLANFSMCLILAPLFGYVGLAGPVYIGYFGLSEASFALIFAVAPIHNMTGAFLCTRLLNRIEDRRLIRYSLRGCVVAGTFLLLAGSLHFVTFAIGIGMFAFFAGLSRPLCNHLILEQVSQDIGAASSTIIFTQFMAGALCMAYATASWSQPILAFSLSTILLPGVVLLLWPSLLRRLKFEPGPSSPRRAPERAEPSPTTRL